MLGIIFSLGMGMIIGSFLNVCICRLPKDESIVFPASHCTKCSTPIKWHDNIPVISWIVLGGKCRSCKEPISLQYPIVEMLSGISTMLFYAHWSHYWPWLIVCLIALYVFIVMSVIDLQTMLISDLFSIILVVLGLISSPINPCFAEYAQGWLGCLGQSVLGILAGGGFLWALAVIGKMIFGKDAMGEGDIILLGAIGSLCGWRGVLTTVMMAAFFGTAYSFSLIFLKKANIKSAMAFGPCLALGALVNMYHFLPPSAFFIEIPL